MTSFVSTAAPRPLPAPTPIAPGRIRAPAWSLPVPLTPLVERPQQVAQAAGLLRTETIRLLTLTGPGGVGKTRLALRLADEVSGEYPGGIAFVPLAAVTDPDHLLLAIAAVIGFPEAGTVPLVTHLVSVLAGPPRLLVLDTFEQIVAAGPLVTDLLSACPSVTIIVTSRIVLGVSGEQEFVVAPMTVPGASRSRSLAEIAASEAVALFLLRARAIDPTFELTDANASAIIEICQRLDGLPLAIELAAARTKVLSPQDLAARLSRRLRVLIGGARDQPARLQTMRGAIDWSYDLLDAREQALFRRLSVFAGGFSLAAAEAVVPGDDTLDLLDSLVGKSLVQPMSGPAGRRFALLEIIREYGQEQLTLSGEQLETHRRHAEWCYAVAQQTTTADLRRAVPDAVRHVTAERDNFRVALTWLHGHHPPAALQLAVWLYPVWYMQGALREARDWLERTLAAGDTAAPDLRARGLFALAKINSETGEDDQDQAIAIFEESLSLSITTGDDAFAARCLANIGLAEERAGRDEQALARFEAARERYVAIGDTVGTINQLVNLGDTAWRLGDLERSEHYCRMALAHPAANDDRFDLAMVRINLAQIALSRGAITDAHSHLLDALAEFATIDFQIGIIDVVAGMAAVAQAVSQSDVAARWLGVVDAACSRVGMAAVPHHGLWTRTLAATRASLDTVAFAAAHEAGMTLALDEALAEVQQWHPPVARPATAGSGVLSPREQEVVQLLVAGHSDREIAEALFISHRTAQGHVGSIFNKLGVNSRTAAATTAIRLGLVIDPG